MSSKRRRTITPASAEKEDLLDLMRYFARKEMEATSKQKRNANQDFHHKAKLTSAPVTNYVSSRGSVFSTCHWMRAMGVREELIKFLTKPKINASSTELLATSINAKRSRRSIKISISAALSERNSFREQSQEKYPALYAARQGNADFDDLEHSDEFLTGEVQQFRPVLQRGNLVWSNDWTSQHVHVAKEPFRPAPIAIKNVLRSNLRLLGHLHTLGKQHPRESLFDRAASQLHVEVCKEGREGAEVGEEEDVTSNVRASLQRQAMENAIGRHLEGVVEAAILFGYSSRYSSLTQEDEDEVVESNEQVSWENFLLFIQSLSEDLGASKTVAFKVDDSLPCIQLTQKLLARVRLRLANTLASLL